MKFAYSVVVLSSSVMALGEQAVPGYNRCGVRGIQTQRIVNGVQAIGNEFPWQVSVRISSTGLHNCGGSILNRQWILTAAHCFYNGTYSLTHQPENWNIAVGFHGNGVDVSPEDQKKGSAIIGIAKIIVHPGYSAEMLHNDVALVSLQHNIDFSANESANVRQVCLPTASLDAHIQESIVGNAGDERDARQESCIVSGWGAQQNNTKTDPNLLAYMTTPLVGNEFCNSKWSTSTWPLDIIDSQICSMVNNPTIGTTNKGPCFGDSGGPLVCKLTQTTHLVQMGVVSFGPVDMFQESPRCGVPGPSVYTRVSSFLYWIQSETEAGDLAVVDMTPASSRTSGSASGTRGFQLVVVGFLGIQFVVFVLSGL